MGSGQGLLYSPGDILYTWPCQDPALLAAFYERCHLDPESEVQIGGDDVAGSNEGEEGEARSVTVGALVSECLDVTSASPRRYFFEVTNRTEHTIILVFLII